MSDWELKNVDAVARAVSRLAKSVPNEVARALYEEAQIEATESRRRTPVKTGSLRASTEVTHPVIDESGISVTIRVGGVAAPYALIVHEDLQAFHKVGQAKFLESTVLESAPFMSARVAKRIDLNKAAR